MKKFLIISMFAVMASMLFSSSTGTVKPEALATVYSLPKESLSNFEASSLIFMIEEEKLARDVYMTLYKIWRAKTFGNIALSEVTHMQMVQALLEK